MTRRRIACKHRDRFRRSSDDINSDQTEQRGSCEEMPVVRMDLMKTRPGCRGEVNRVGSAKVRSDRSRREDSLNGIEKRIGQGNQKDVAIRYIGIELSEYSTDGDRTGETLAHFSKSYRVELSPAMMRTNDLITRISKLLDLNRPALDPVKLAKIGCVKE
jgi:hypothetical protein